MCSILLNISNSLLFFYFRRSNVALTRAKRFVPAFAMIFTLVYLCLCRRSFVFVLTLFSLRDTSYFSTKWLCFLIIFKSKILLVRWFLFLPRHLLIVGNLKMLSCNAVWGKVIEHCGSKLLIPPPPFFFFHDIIRQNLLSSLDSLPFIPINYGKNRSP